MLLSFLGFSVTVLLTVTVAVRVLVAVFVTAVFTLGRSGIEHHSDSGKTVVALDAVYKVYGIFLRYTFAHYIQGYIGHAVEHEGV